MLHLDFKLHYLEREQLSSDEIEEAGFSGDDDYEWSGTLPVEWELPILKLVRNSELESQEEEHFCYLICEVPDQEKIQILEGFAINGQEWGYLLQEIQQAVFELSGREKPLKIRFFHGLEKEFEAHFASRTVVWKNAKKTGKMNWVSFTHFASQIYSLDFDETLKTSRPDKTKAKYWLDPGEGVWYPLPAGVNRNHKNKKTVDKIIETLLRENPS